jgi:hypothetical protein
MLAVPAWADDSIWVEQYEFGTGEWNDYLVFPGEDMYYELGSGEWVHIITDQGVVIRIQTEEQE